ncbi:MAG TPA: TetR/AcrR family transcriptional regulator [Rhizomicrobium sp.]|nr:TetR/AcrR family transcriptional regulator [Rhizomicrobium sp.]
MAAVLEKRRGKKSEGDDKRVRLLEAALDLFETRGFDAVAVPEIAAKAGVAVGTVYRYFETKEALVNALYRHWKQAYNDFVLAPAPRNMRPRELFSRYWNRMTLFARSNPRAVRFMDLHHHAAYLDEESRALSKSYARAAEEFVRAARAEGAIRDLNPTMVVALMWGAAVGLTKFAASGALEFDAKMAGEMEDALWRAIASSSNGEN